MRRLADTPAPGRALASGCIRFRGRPQAGGFSMASALASRSRLFLLMAAVAVGAAAQSVPPAPPAPPAPAVPPAPSALPAAGQPLREQVERRFEVLPVSDGLLLRPREPMAGIRALEVRDGELAIDGKAAEAEELEQRIGVAAAAPVRALLELDPDELRDLFELSPGRAEDSDVLRERLDQEMERRRAEIEREQEAIRRRLEKEMERHADDVQRRQEDITREIERATRRGHRRSSDDARVVMGTPVHVGKEETTGDVVAIGGSITVEGEVMGDAVTVGGSERVDGLVTGSVVSVGGSIHLGPHARVLQDVVSVGGSVEREPGAEILGQVTEVSLWQGMTGNWFGNWGGWRWNVDRTPSSYFDGALLRFLRAMVFVFVLILIGALAAVIARHPLERMSAAAGAEPWKAGVVGLLAVVLFVPAILIVLVLLAVSIIGIPLLLLWPFAVLACIFAAFFGYLSAAHSLARWAEGRFGWRLAGPVPTVVLGLFLLHGSWLMARLVDVVDSSRDIGGFLRIMLLLFWMLVNLSAAFVGIGAVLLARRAGPMPSTAIAAAPPAVPPPMPPPAPGRQLYDQPAVESSGAESAADAGEVGEPEWEEPFAEFDEPDRSTAEEDGEEGEGPDEPGDAQRREA